MLKGIIKVNNICDELGSFILRNLKNVIVDHNSRLSDVMETLLPSDFGHLPGNTSNTGDEVLTKNVPHIVGFQSFSYSTRPLNIFKSRY
jgi:hypothetical protein